MVSTNDNDLILCQITTQTRQDNYSIPLEIQDFTLGQLKNSRYLPYNRALVERARELRKNMTQLWNKYLRYLPARVLRQRPIDNFIQLKASPKMYLMYFDENKVSLENPYFCAKLSLCTINGTIFCEINGTLLHLSFCQMFLLIVLPYLSQHQSMVNKIYFLQFQA